MLKKPAIEIAIKSSDCGLIVIVNGCQLTRDNTGDPIDTLQVINPFVRSGENEFEVLLLLGPADEPNVAQLQLEIKIREMGDQPGSGILLTRIAYDGRLASTGKATSASTPPWRLMSIEGYRRDDSGDVEVGPVEAKHLPPPFTNQSPSLRRKLSMPLPFPTWAFFGGDFMPEGWSQAAPTQGVERQLYDALLASYHEIWSALAAKDIASLEVLLDERSREYDRALYLQPGTTWGTCSHRIEEMRQGGRLAPIADEGKPWLVEARVPRMRTTFLSFGPYASPILRYVTDETAQYVYADVLPVWFRRQGSEFILTR